MSSLSCRPLVQTFVAILLALGLANCSKSETQKAALEFCVPEGFQCTGVEAHRSCSNGCADEAQCASVCAEFTRCAEQCDCNSPASCMDQCAKGMSDPCRQCSAKVDQCIDSRCTAPQCNATGDDAGSLPMGDDGGTNSPDATSVDSAVDSQGAVMSACEQLTICCNQLPDIASQQACLSYGRGEVNGTCRVGLNAYCP